MDSDNFFGFDASGLDDETDHLNGEEGPDEDYDVLNDETFGAHMGEGVDWEQGHEQMASLTEASRQQHKMSQAHQANFGQECSGLEESLQNLSMGQYIGSSMPINISNYHTSYQPQHGSPHLGLLAGGPDLGESPSSNSIWTPSPVTDKLHPVIDQQNNGLSRSLGLSESGFIGSMAGLPAIKTVAELEEEIKLQHFRRQQQQDGQQQLNMGMLMNSLRVEEVERELARQSANKQQIQHSFSGIQHPGTIASGVINNSNNNQFINSRVYPRMFPNQGGQVGSFQPIHVHRFPPNSFPSNRPISQNTQYPTMQHNNHHLNNHNQFPHHLNTHDSNLHFGNNPPPFHQLNNRNGDNRYFNHNGFDLAHVRNGPFYDKRHFEQQRRPFEQTRGFDQSRNQYEHRDSENGRNGNNFSGSRTRRDSEAEWEEWHRMREQDEYCGLMTPREKSWLKNIQSMQLHSHSPYQDDYYYVMYSVKQQHKREEEIIEIEGLQLLIPDRAKDGGREYEPPHLENSLGKLQVVTVNAPRKIIDLQVIHLDPAHPTTPLQREMRKHRHLLLYIEKLYVTLMELDDLERKIRLLPDCPTRDSYKIKTKQLISHLWLNCSSPNDRLIQLFCIKKGKSLIYRLMHCLGEVECEKLVHTILGNLSLLVKRDQHDNQLVVFWPFIDRMVALSDYHLLLTLAGTLTSSQSAKSGIVGSSLMNRFGISVVMSMLVRGEQLLSQLENEVVWQNFLCAVITALSAHSDSNKIGESNNKIEKWESSLQALPSIVIAASPLRPAQHLLRCVSVDQRLIKTAQDRLSAIETTAQNTVNKVKVISPLKV